MTVRMPTDCSGTWLPIRMTQISLGSQLAKPSRATVTKKNRLSNGTIRAGEAEILALTGGYDADRLLVVGPADAGVIRGR